LIGDTLDLFLFLIFQKTLLKKRSLQKIRYVYLESTCAAMQDSLRPWGRQHLSILQID